MNRKILFYTFALMALLLNGCSQDNTQATKNPLENASQATTVPESGAVQNGLQTNMISEEEAKEIALAHAGLTKDHVTFIKSDIDRDNGQKSYDVEFHTQDQTEYDYEIDPYTGAILNYDYDAEYFAKPSAIPESEPITADVARQIALDKVPGATAQNVQEFESDYDNGKLHYEGKLYYEKQEYEFEIDGYNGAILEWNIEPIYGGV